MLGPSFSTIILFSSTRHLHLLHGSSIPSKLTTGLFRYPQSTQRAGLPRPEWKASGFQLDLKGSTNF